MLVLLATVTVANASSLQVDGIPVRGKSRDVSDSDVRNAIRAVHGKVSRVEVLNADRMCVYYKPIDLGWVACLHPAACQGGLIRRLVRYVA